MYWPAWKSDRLVELDEDALDGGRQVLDARHRAGEVAHRDRSASGSSSISASITTSDSSRGAAGQRLALLALEVHQRKGGGLAVVDLAVEHLHLAGGAQAVAAGVRQPDAGAQAASRMVWPSSTSMVWPSGSMVSS
jgi:hypothetical protein